MIATLGESEDWIVLNKPAGWYTIPPRPGATPAPVVSQWASERSPHWRPVHRLDRDTSGVLVVAKHVKAYRELARAFEERSTHKLYDLWCAGSWPRPVLRIDKPIGDQRALTQLSAVRELRPGVWLARARPWSGRTHQIRIHAARAGLPLLGDPRYGGLAEWDGRPIPRVLLHARSLVIEQMGIHFEAAWPQDLEEWTQYLSN